jgi:DNA-binding MarR family transcriptional regulator
MVQEWRRRDPKVNSSSLQVIGRLLLCASYCERAVIAALGPFELSMADFDVLNTLRRLADQHGSKPTDLARSSLITTGAMTSRLDRLERSGLICRTPDPTDRRGVLVRLTPQGSKVAMRALQEVIAAQEAFLEPLSGQERESIASALRLLLLHHEPR